MNVSRAIYQIILRIEMKKNDAPLELDERFKVSIADLSADILQVFNTFLTNHEKDYSENALWAASMDALTKNFLIMCKFFNVTDVPQALDRFRKGALMTKVIFDDLIKMEKSKH